MYKILHVAPHLGGGVGRFFGNVLKYDLKYNHEFLLLEPPKNPSLLEALNISWQIWGGRHDSFERYTKSCCLIEIDYWNHPALLLFMLQQKFDTLPVVLYSFISGSAPPNYIPSQVIKFADWIILPGPSSLENIDLVERLGPYSVVFALGGTSRTEGLKKKPHNTLYISYVGTAGDEKLNIDFSWACKQILANHPNIRFRFASNDSNEHLQKQAHLLGIFDSIEFSTAVEDIAEFHSTSDIFGYPLSPDHYGTGEQALLEAMGAGIPPVVLDNPAERQLVQDGKTGLIARDIREYVDLVCFLIEDHNFRQTLSENARLYARAHFSAESTCSKLSRIYDGLMGSTRKARSLDMAYFSSDNLGWELFKLGIGEDSAAVHFFNSVTVSERNYWKLKGRSLRYLLSNVKGGLGQYLKYFPHDPKLNYLSHIFRNN
jgi:glycosyltransferase involved in cell wall biosynthesis